MVTNEGDWIAVELLGVGKNKDCEIKNQLFFLFFFRETQFEVFFAVFFRLTNVFNLEKRCNYIHFDGIAFI